MYPLTGLVGVVVDVGVVVVVVFFFVVVVVVEVVVVVGRVVVVEVVLVVVVVDVVVAVVDVVVAVVDVVVSVVVVVVSVVDVVVLVVVVVVDDVVVVAGVHGVPVASEVRNGVKSTLAVTLSQPALPGPAAQPHQLFSASPSVLVDAAVLSVTPLGTLLPAKLLLWIIVPMVPGLAPSSSSRMPPKGVTTQPPKGQGENVGGLLPFRLKQLFSTVTFCAPLRTSRPALPALSKVLPRIISPLALPSSCHPTFARCIKVFPDTVVLVSFLSPKPPNPIS